jgi:hypothetical protein
MRHRPVAGQRTYNFEVLDVIPQLVSNDGLRALHRAVQDPLRVHVFDVPMLAGVDLRSLP